MKILPSLFAGVAALTLAACATAQAESAMTPPTAQSNADDLKAFPAATAGQTRHVIRLPAQSDEEARKVEVIVGKTMRGDCNRHSCGGRLVERTAEGLSLIHI